MIPTTTRNSPLNPHAAEPMAGDVAFNATLTPHRSLGPLGFNLLIGFFAAASLAIGIGFLMIGAWPVARALRLALDRLRCSPLSTTAG